MDESEQIKEESNGKLEVKETLRFGHIVYNRDHSKENVVTIETDIDSITGLRLKGWTPLPGNHKWIMRAPEVVLCDLSEIHANPTTDIREIFTLYKILDSSDFEEIRAMVASEPKFHNLEIVRLGTDGASPEYRIAATDERVRELPERLLKILEKSERWKREMDDTKWLVQKRDISVHKKHIADCRNLTKHLHEEVRLKYSNILNTVHSPVGDEVISGYGYQIPQKDVYIFVPRAGLKYAFGFVDDMLDSDKVMFWECHIGPDLDKELVLFGKELEGKDAAIIDRSYSSNTLVYLKQEVEKKGGIPYRISMFPKSRPAVENCEGFLYIDKFFEKSACKGDYGNKWPEDLFMTVINTAK